MKILSVADIHGNMKIFKEIKNIIEEKNVDILILPGDLYPKPDEVTFETFKGIQEASAMDISNLLEDLTIPIYYILGNDDWIETGINCGINIHQRLIEHNGVYFTGFEYVPKTSFNTNREMSEDRLKKTFIKQVNDLELHNKKPLVIVGHTPLFMKQDKTINGKCVGSRKLRMEIEKVNPMLYLCGHIHEAYGSDMLGPMPILNCACSYEIDLLRGYLIEIDGDIVSYESIIK